MPSCSAWGDIVGLPYVVTALIAVGALAAALAAANAMALAIAEALGHDIYGRLIDPHASAGRRLIVTRLLLIGTVLGAAMARREIFGATFLRLASVAVSLSAGGPFSGGHTRRSGGSGANRWRRHRRHDRGLRGDRGNDRRRYAFRVPCPSTPTPSA